MTCVPIDSSARKGGGIYDKTRSSDYDTPAENMREIGSAFRFALGF